MRVLFTFAGGIGHFLPLRPIAGAMAAQGHGVAFCAQPAMLPMVEQAGFDVFDTGGRTMPEPTARRPLLPLDMEREYRAVREGYAGRIARQRAPAILERARLWKPDVLVCDEMDFGCPVAAECLALPYATVLVIASGALVRREAVAEPLGLLRARHGLPPDRELQMLGRHLVLSPFPPSLRDPSHPLPATAHVFRPASPKAGASPAASVRPLIYATLGTVFNAESGDLFARLLAGLRDLPVDVLATVGPQRDPRELGPQPENVRIERFVDQWSLLPRCDLVVSHAGSGTVCGALAHGLPMLLLPLGADQPFNARRCAQLGVARVLDPVGLAPAAVRQAVAGLLADDSHRMAARRMMAEIAALPGQESAIARLNELARRAGTA